MVSAAVRMFILLLPRLGTAQNVFSEQVDVSYAGYFSMVLTNLSSITPIIISSATLRDGNAKGLACCIQDAEELSPGNLSSWKTRSIS